MKQTTKSCGVTKAEVFRKNKEMKSYREALKTDCDDILCMIYSIYDILCIINISDNLPMKWQN